MRVLLAPDGFGETLSPAEAARAMADGWAQQAPEDVLDLAPLSDGGPGLVEVVATALPMAQLRRADVEDALGRPTRATWLLAEGTAWIESAQACGLHLLALDERDPTRTSTYGVGQLVGAALDAGADRIVVGLGGSASNDGGAGLLAALGVLPYDADERALAPGGAALRTLDQLVGGLDPRLTGVEIVAATDVDNPLLGLRGASAVYGPQKGADRDAVARLDAALERWADVLEPFLDRQVRHQSGAGAAGGLGAALLALGAHRAGGLAMVQQLVGLPARLERVDLVLTGEGLLDATSLSGKVVGGVAAAAAEAAVPCLVLAGEVRAGRRELAAAGVTEAHSLVELVGRDRAVGQAASALSELAARVARQWSR